MGRITDTAFRNISHASTVAAANIAFNKAPGAREQQTVFVANYVNGKAAYVETKTRNTLHQSAEIIGTNDVTDIVVNSSNGMAVVKTGKDADAPVAYTKGGSFRLTEDGYYKTESGHYMVGWLLDANGKLPADSALLTSLTPVNLTHLTARGEATTKVSVSGNLNAQAESLKGPGTLFQLSKSGLNSNTLADRDINGGGDIIIPEDLARGNGSLRQGDRFNISTKADQIRTYEFGGIAIGRSPAGMSGGLYGVFKSDQRFNISNGGTPPNQMPTGGGIRIAIGTGTYEFKTVAETPDASQGQFNSIDTLARAINLSQSDLKARVDSKGRLLITQNDANQTMAFTDIGGSNLKQLLGLTDIAAPAADIKRFATLTQLKDQIKTEEDVTGLTAEIKDRALSINAAVSTASFTITGETNRVNRFQNAVTGDFYANQNAQNNQGSNQYTIISANHGLKVGDWVQIGGATGDLNILPGRYMVGKVDSTGDAFSIYNRVALAGAPLAAIVPGSVDATWEKIAATVNTPTVNPALGYDTVSAIASAGTTITLTLSPGAKADYQVGDLVYLSGIGNYTQGGRNVRLPDGYYILPALPAGANDINLVAVSDVAGTTFPAVGTTLGTAQIRKITLGANAGATTGAEDTPVLQAVNGEKQVKLNLPNHNYGVGDYIKFSGLDVVGYQVSSAPADISNIITNDTAYKIISVTAHDITFELNDPAAVNFSTSDSSFYGAASAPAANVGPDFRVNHYSRAFEAAVGIGQDPDSATQDATYAADNAKKSLFSGKHAEAEALNGSVDVIDNLGIKHQLILRFAKLNKNEWVVEVGKLRDPKTGDFNDIYIEREDGVLASGILKFSAVDGSFAGFGDGNIKEPITLNWTDGSAPTTISLDWGVIGGGINNAPGAKQGIRQIGGRSETYEIIANGSQAGKLRDIEINTEGFIIGNFTNGEIRSLFQLPIATFTNINGLIAGEGGTFTTTAASGKPVLQEAGGGYGEILSRAIEGTNIKVIEQLSEIQDYGLGAQALAKAGQLIYEDEKNFMAAIR